MLGPDWASQRFGGSTKWLTSRRLSRFLGDKKERHLTWDKMPLSLKRNDFPFWHCKYTMSFAK